MGGGSPGCAGTRRGARGTTFDDRPRRSWSSSATSRFSTCEHHLLPLHGSPCRLHPQCGGVVPVCPNSPGLVDRRPPPQVQGGSPPRSPTTPRRHLDVRGVIVVIEAEHLHVDARVHRPGESADHLAVRVALAKNAAAAPRRSWCCWGTGDPIMGVVNVHARLLLRRRRRVLDPPAATFTGCN